MASGEARTVSGDWEESFSNTNRRGRRTWRSCYLGARSRPRSRGEARGSPKCLGENFPQIKIDRHAIALDESNAARLVAEHDFVIDATDSPLAKFLINDACIAARKPFAYGGVIGMTGQAMTVIPGVSACLRCVFENPPDTDEIQSCREAGILGPVAGAIGAMQATDAMRASRAQSPLLSGKILTYDAAHLARVRITEVNPRPGCGCGASKMQPAAATIGVGHRGG
jgi:molybdopterin/thiamine biosynthesis adenylyltransferase